MKTKQHHNNQQRQGRSDPFHSRGWAEDARAAIKQIFHSDLQRIRIRNFATSFEVEGFFLFWGYERHFKLQFSQYGRGKTGPILPKVKSHVLTLQAGKYRSIADMKAALWEVRKIWELGKASEDRFFKDIIDYQSDISPLLLGIRRATNRQDYEGTDGFLECTNKKKTKRFDIPFNIKSSRRWTEDSPYTIREGIVIINWGSEHHGKREVMKKFIPEIISIYANTDNEPNPAA